VTPDLPAILYVDDDPPSRKVMDHILSRKLRLPHVTILPDSTNFIEQVEALDPVPNIIFLDIHIKPLSGFDMLKLLRAHPTLAGVIIVALTASVMNEEVALLRQAGFDGCLAKPLESKSMPELLNRLMRGEKIWRILA
jgi:two-component system cell cycle response regulator DivK